MPSTPPTRHLPTTDYNYPDTRGPSITRSELTVADAYRDDHRFTLRGL